MWRVVTSQDKESCGLLKKKEGRGLDQVIDFQLAIYTEVYPSMSRYIFLSKMTIMISGCQTTLLESTMEVKL